MELETLKQYITFPVALFSIIGVWLNIKHNKYCFYIWAVTNASWVVIDVWYKVWAQALLFFIYFCLAIYGIWEWRTKKI